MTDSEMLPSQKLTPKTPVPNLKQTGQKSGLFLSNDKLPSLLAVGMMIRFYIVMFFFYLKN